MASEIPNRQIIKNPWSRVIKNIIADLLLDNYYFVDARVCDSWDLTIHSSTTLEILSMVEGQKMSFILIASTSIIPVAITFTAVETIRWLDNETPSIESRGLVTLYKSNGIIFAEFIKTFVDAADAGCCDGAPCGTETIDGGFADTTYICP